MAFGILQQRLHRYIPHLSLIHKPYHILRYSFYLWRFINTTVVVVAVVREKPEGSIGPLTTYMRYFELLDRVAETGRAVIMYDQLGCGKSFVEGHPELWTPETWLNELCAPLVAKLSMTAFLIPNGISS